MSGNAADSPDALAAEVVSALGARGLTVATAESLTGGLVAATLSSVPGASAVLRGGLVVYATELKHTLAGVDPALLAEAGPVDPRVAAQLASGAARTCGADIGVSCTGVAGPEPQGGKPVGLVFIGISGPGGADVVECRFPGDRAAVRTSTVVTVLRTVLDAARGQSVGRENAGKRP